MKFSDKILDDFIDIAVKKDYIAKGICLFLSIILWAYINYSRTGEMKFRIPISFKNLSEDYVVSEISKKSVTVKIDGEKENLQNVDVKKISVFIDLRKPRIDVVKEYAVEMLHSQIPEGIHVSLVERKLKLRVERKIARRIPIEPQVIGSVPGDFVLGSITARPVLLLVKGAKSRIDTLENIKTVPVSVSGEKELVVKTTEIYEDDLAGLEYAPVPIAVSIPVHNKDDVLALEVPVGLRNASPDFIYDVKDGILNFKVVHGDNESIDEDDIDAFIDLKSINFDSAIKKNKGEPIERQFRLKYTIKKKMKDLDIIEIDKKRITVKIIKK